MDFIASPLGVMLILVAVAVAAVSFKPANPMGDWTELWGLYGTDKQPSSVAFKDEEIRLGDAKHLLGGFARVDIALDDDALWILSTDPDAKNQPTALAIPWDCVRYRQSKDEQQNFQLRGSDPIEFWVADELGDAMQRRSLRYEIEDPL